MPIQYVTRKNPTIIPGHLKSSTNAGIYAGLNHFNAGTIFSNTSAVTGSTYIRKIAGGSCIEIVNMRNIMGYVVNRRL